MLTGELCRAVAAGLAPGGAHHCTYAAVPALTARGYESGNARSTQYRSELTFISLLRVDSGNREKIVIVVKSLKLQIKGYSEVQGYQARPNIDKARQETG